MDRLKLIPDLRKQKPIFRLFLTAISASLIMAKLTGLPNLPDSHPVTKLERQIQRNDVKYADPKLLEEAGINIYTPAGVTFNPAFESLRNYGIFADHIDAIKRHNNSNVHIIFLDDAQVFRSKQYSNLATHSGRRIPPEIMSVLQQEFSRYNFDPKDVSTTDYEEMKAYKIKQTLAEIDYLEMIYPKASKEFQENIRERVSYNRYLLACLDNIDTSLCLPAKEVINKSIADAIALTKGEALGVYIENRGNPIVIITLKMFQIGGFANETIKETNTSNSNHTKLTISEEWLVNNSQTLPGQLISLKKYTNRVGSLNNGYLFDEYSIGNLYAHEIAHHDEQKKSFSETKKFIEQILSGNSAAHSFYPDLMAINSKGKIGKLTILKDGNVIFQNNY